MDFEKIKNFKFDKNNFDIKKLKESFWSFLLNRFGFIFMSIFFIAALGGGIVIYKYAYNSDWSDAQKEEYRMKVEKGKPPFNLNKFNDVISKIEKRKELDDAEISVPKDIFGISK